MPMMSVLLLFRNVGDRPPTSARLCMRVRAPPSSCDWSLLPGVYRLCCGVFEFLTRESEQVEKAKAQIAVEVYTAMTEALNAK